jgi:ribosomal protein S25
LGKYIIQKLPGAQSLLFNIHKPKVLIWRLDGFTKVSECYELKYSKDISTIEQNSMAYENGDGYLWNDDEFDVLDSMKINGMGKGEYQDFIKYQRGLDTNKPVVDDSGKVVREWLPDDFCDYFICKDGEPVRVSCARYEPGGNLVDEGIQEQSIRYTDEWIVNANQAIDSTKSTFNDIGLKGEEISGKIKEKTKLSDEDKAEIDKMIENLSEGELNEILKQVRDQSVKSKNNIINNNNTAVEVVQGIGD